MIDTARLDLDSLSRFYLFSNIPWYLFSHFRRDETVRQLAEMYTSSELIDAIVEIDAKQERTLEDLTIAYAALVALSFRDFDEVHLALPSLGGVTSLAWLDRILEYVLATQASTATNELRAQPKIVASESKPRTESQMTTEVGTLVAERQ